MTRRLLLVLACTGLLACGATDGADERTSDSSEATTDATGMGVPKSPVAGLDSTGDLEQEEEETAQDEDLIAAREAVERNPTDAEAHRRLGVALRRARLLDESFLHLEKAAELAPRDTDVLLSLGIAYANAHRLSEAEATYTRILRIDPDHARALNNLGNVALRRGDEAGAIELYRRAVDADPDYLMAMHKLADLLKYHGRHDEAYATYEKILQMTPQGPRERIAMVESLYGMGSISLSRERYELAEQQLAQVVRNIPNHRSAHWARAQALIQLDRHDEAQQELQMHVRILHAMGEGF